MELATGKFGWRDGFAIVFHHYASRQKFLREQKVFNRTRQCGGEPLTVRNDHEIAHHVSVSKLTSGGQLMRTPYTLPTPFVM